jgi:hypothetical protein
LDAVVERSVGHGYRGGKWPIRGQRVDDLGCLEQADRDEYQVGLRVLVEVVAKLETLGVKVGFGTLGAG